MAAVTICSDFRAQENSLSLFPLFPSLFAMKWWNRMPWSSFSECWALSKVFHSLSLSSRGSLVPLHFLPLEWCHLRLLIFLPAILIPACASSIPAFHMMYSAFKLSKQGDTVQPWRTPFLGPLHCSTSSSNCCFLTCIQISQEAGSVVWYSHLFQNFPQFVVIHTVKGFGIVNKAEVDVFQEFFCFFYDPTDVGNLVFGSSVFLNPSWTSVSSLFMYCWSLAWRILSITLLACEMIAIVW